MMFEAQLLEMMKMIKDNQDEILSRMKKLENQVNGEWTTIREVADIKGCSVQAIHQNLVRNPDLEPEVDWIKRGGKYLIKKVALSRIMIKKSA